MNTPTASTWLDSARWGVFCHYLAHFPGRPVDDGMTVDRWKRQVDAFDVDGLVAQLQEIGTDYFVLTIAQRAGFACTPNKAFAEIVGTELDTSADRDLVADVGEALAPTGIRLMVYLQASPPAGEEMAKRFHFREGLSESGFENYSRLADENPEQPLTRCQELWEQVIREWSERWGERVHGWWIDGAYLRFLEGSFGGLPNFPSYARALKAGNPQSIVAFNKGVLHAGEHKLERYTIADDYTAGELTDALPLLWTWERKPCRYQSRDDFDLTPHALGFLGDFWGRGEPRFPDELLVGYTKYLNAYGGVCSWDVPPQADGLLAPAFMPQLRKLGDAVRAG